MESLFYGNKKCISFYIVTSLIGVLAVGHYDSNAIVEWAVELLRTIGHGDLYNYQNNLQQIGMPTNYGLFINAIDAVIILPIYFIESFIRPVSLILYITWYKLILSVVLVMTIKVLSKMMAFWGIDESRIEILVGLSFLTLVYGVAMGQVDLLSIFFMSLGLYYGSKEAYCKMSLCFSLAVMIKAFPILAISPVFIYLFKKQFMNKKALKWLAEVVIFVGPFMVERVIENCLLDNYLEYAHMVNEYNFIPKLFAVSVAGISIYVLMTFITLFVYFVLALVDKTNSITGLIICIDLMYFLFYSFIDYSPQYLIYGMVFYMITVDVMRRRRYLIWLLFNVAVLAISIGHFNESTLNAFLLSNSLIGKMTNIKEFYIGDLVSKPIKEWMWIAGRVLVSGLSVWMIVKLYIQRNCRIKGYEVEKN